MPQPAPLPQKKSWRERLFVVVFHADTRAGRLFDEILLLTIFTSLLVVMLDSVADIHRQYGRLLNLLEWSFTALFAIEYLLRLYCSPRPLRYAFSFYGMVDLLAVLPGVLALLLSDAQYLIIIRVLLKLTPYLSQANFLLTALRGSRQKIIVFLLNVSALVIIFGTLMYVIEGPRNGFTSIPVSIYWAVVTLTTVGFGDITPKTPLGQGLATLIMITGYSIIAVPTGIFTAELANAMHSDDALQHPCPSCGKDSHAAHASFCNRCGNPLFPKSSA